MEKIKNDIYTKNELTETAEKKRKVNCHIRNKCLIQYNYSIKITNCNSNATFVSDETFDISEQSEQKMEKREKT